MDTIKTQMSTTRKCHDQRLQTYSRHCGEETKNTESHNTKVVSNLGSPSFENLDEFSVTTHISQLT